jgi:hypothetical protein
MYFSRVLAIAGEGISCKVSRRRFYSSRQQLTETLIVDLHLLVRFILFAETNQCAGATTCEPDEPNLEKENHVPEGVCVDFPI